MKHFDYRVTKCGFMGLGKPETHKRDVGSWQDQRALEILQVNDGLVKAARRFRVWGCPEP